MLRLPAIQGLIRRRLLVNFRADPAVVAKLLPAGFRPKLHRGYSIVGICLIRLEGIRPMGIPAGLGLTSENAAHRIAVEWDKREAEARDSSLSSREGVYIPRRDTGSALNALAGGRVFPGEHHHSRFEVDDDGTLIRFSMQSGEACGCHADESERIAIHLEARSAERLPPGSVFRSVSEASAYFEGGCVGYSATCDSSRLDGIKLHTERWEVTPLDVLRVHSTWFLDSHRFPPGSLTFDHALIMRNIPHEWHSVDDYAVAATQ